jgi:hypothetical protein
VRRLLVVLLEVPVFTAEMRRMAYEEDIWVVDDSDSQRTLNGLSSTKSPESNSTCNGLPVCGPSLSA